MSLKGSILRGEKYYLQNRDEEGVLKKVISGDPNKMVDVNAYLAKVKEAEAKLEKEKPKSSSDKSAEKK